MESIKNYAKARNISYEAARKQVKRYAAELEGHIRTQNRTQYLDNYAVELLDSHRQSSPIVIMQQDKDDELQQLRQENKALLQQVAALQDKLLTARESAIEAAKQTAMLEAAQADKDRLEREKAALQSELEAARRPWWKKIMR
mgnify:FL=1